MNFYQYENVKGHNHSNSAVWRQLTLPLSRHVIYYMQSFDITITFDIIILLLLLQSLSYNTITITPPPHLLIWAKAQIIPLTQKTVYLLSFFFYGNFPRPNSPTVFPLSQ